MRKRKTSKCKNCGKEFILDGRKFFCSSKCYHKFTKGKKQKRKKKEKPKSYIDYLKKEIEKTKDKEETKKLKKIIKNFNYLKRFYPQ